MLVKNVSDLVKTTLGAGLISENGELGHELLNLGTYLRRQTELGVEQSSHMFSGALVSARNAYSGLRAVLRDPESLPRDPRLNRLGEQLEQWLVYVHPVNSHTVRRVEMHDYKLLERLMTGEGALGKRFEWARPIRDETDLIQRVTDPRRRIYVYRDPLGVPLFFLQIALTEGVTPSMDRLTTLSDKRTQPLPTTITPYAIDQIASAGVPLGPTFLKEVDRQLRTEFPDLVEKATLSPIYRYRHWVEREATQEFIIDSGAQRVVGNRLSEVRDFIRQHNTSDQDLLRAFQTKGWAQYEYLGQLLPFYLSHGRRTHGRFRAEDGVAHVHLSNGAQLFQINPLSDTSAVGLRRSFGFMVNYFYDYNHQLSNQESYQRGIIVVSSEIEKMRRSQVPLRLNQDYGSLEFGL